MINKDLNHEMVLHILAGARSITINFDDVDVDVEINDDKAKTNDYLMATKLKLMNLVKRLDADLLELQTLYPYSQLAEKVRRVVDKESETSDCSIDTAINLLDLVKRLDARLILLKTHYPRSEIAVETRIVIDKTEVELNEI